MATLVNGILSNCRNFKKISNFKPFSFSKLAFPTCNTFHTSSGRNGLEEFFDDPKFYAKQEVRVGRQWEKDDLRIKSSSDLHKLWYVLLKERNMLKTMEHAYSLSKESMPSPDRIEKVEESMKNLEDVVRERNRAYFQLETGTSGERPNRLVMNMFGLQENKHLDEFPTPVHREDMQEHREFPRGSYVHTFRRLLREKNRRYERQAMLSDMHYVLKVMRKFPDADLDYLQELFPHLQVKKLIYHKFARGGFDRREASWSKPGMF